MEAYKEQLEAWMESHPNSKLHKTTQVVHFVDDQAQEFSPEDTCAKLTRNMGKALQQGGGEFKMRSGLKKQYGELLDEDVNKVMAALENKVKGPYFVRVI